MHFNKKFPFPFIPSPLLFWMTTKTKNLPKWRVTTATLQEVKYADNHRLISWLICKLFAKMGHMLDLAYWHENNNSLSITKSSFINLFLPLIISESITLLIVIPFLEESGSHFESAQLPVPYRSENSMSITNLVLDPSSLPSRNIKAVHVTNF